uniref:MFS domain-containing protein n=1 Tax=Heterorhabditis bacteriophora TaxID=37862 RepID=A0A1I7X982_HETBA
MPPETKDMSNSQPSSLLSLSESQKVGSKFTLERVLEPSEESVELSYRHLWGGARYVILGLAVLCFTAARSNDMAFTFSIICMTANNTGTQTAPISFSPRDLSLSFAGAGAGAILAALPLALLLHRFGGRIVMGILLLLSSLGTILLPFAARHATNQQLPIALFVFPLRIMQGLAVAAVMPMMGFVSANWAPVGEIGRIKVTKLKELKSIDY